MAISASSWNRWLGTMSRSAPARSVVLPAQLYAEALRDRDLHLLDIAPVPDRLEDPVREAKDENILDGVLPEIVVDPVDLTLGEMALELPVERPSRVVAVPERLLDDEAPPDIADLRRETGRVEVTDRRTEKRRRYGQVIQTVASGPPRRIDMSERLVQNERRPREPRGSPRTK